MKSFTSRLKNHKKKLIALGVLVLGPLGFHIGVGVGTHIDPANVAVPPGAVHEAG